MITQSQTKQRKQSALDLDHYRALARVVKALADPLRLAILDTLRDGERCVQDIAALVRGERSNVSRHLAVLSGVGILTSRKQGLHVYYTLQTPCILNLFNCVRGVMEADLEVSRRALCAAEDSCRDATLPASPSTEARAASTSGTRAGPGATK